eukprot:m.97146 g.97146  ORF g.97146 m.97146 type:complete len:425 (+) comp10203_c0_seq3:401-1675(+)
METQGWARRQHGLESEDACTRVLPEGWPIGQVEFTQGMIWGAADVLASRLSLQPKAYRQSVEAVETPPDVVKALWDDSVDPPRWTAYARTAFAQDEPIGLYAGLLRDDGPALWNRLSDDEAQYTARMTWRGRRLVVDASEYGNLLRFVRLTTDPTVANVRFGIGRCECGRSDPVAALVAFAERAIDANEPLYRLGCQEEVASLERWKQQPPDDTDWSGWSVNAETGAPSPNSDDNEKLWEESSKLYTPISFLDIKAENPHALKDEMCLHLPSPNVRIWEVDDPTHVCYGSRGLKATRDIKCGEVIGRYTGFVTCTSEHDVRGTYTVGINAGQVIDGFVHGNEMRFMNDFRAIAEERNADFAGKVCICRMGEGCVQMLIVASADINAGEEILTDYGKEYWELLYRSVEYAAAGLTDGLDDHDVDF